LRGAKICFRANKQAMPMKEYPAMIKQIPSELFFPPKVLEVAKTRLFAPLKLDTSQFA